MPPNHIQPAGWISTQVGKKRRFLQHVRLQRANIFPVKGPYSLLCDSMVWAEEQSLKSPLSTGNPFYLDESCEVAGVQRQHMWSPLKSQAGCATGKCICSTVWYSLYECLSHLQLSLMLCFWCFSFGLDIYTNIWHLEIQSSENVVYSEQVTWGHSTVLTEATPLKLHLQGAPSCQFKVDILKLRII